MRICGFVKNVSGKTVAIDKFKIIFLKMRVKLTVEEINNFIDLWEYYKGISFRKNVSIHTRECRKTAKTTTREL